MSLASADLRAARRFFQRAIGTIQTIPSEVVTDQAPTYPTILEELLPAARHDTEQYANNRIEADHGLSGTQTRTWAVSCQFAPAGAR